MKKAKKKAIGVLVLGMHRSGTSALTRMLNILGCELPDELLGSNYSNPEGHWESQRAIDINDALLTALGRGWNDIRELPADWLRRPETEGARQQIRAFLDRDFSGKKLWVLKEPRLCRLAPLWLEMMDEAAIEARIIMPVRHPAEVAYSLARRDGISSGRAHLMWLQHLLEAEQATVSRPRVLVHFHELLADWRAQAQRIGKATGIVWPNLDQGSAQIDSFLRPELRHSDARSSGDLGTRAAMPALVANLYQELTATGADENAWKIIRGYAGEFADAAALFSPGIDDLAQRVQHSEHQVASVNSLLLSGLADPSRWQQNAELIGQLRIEAQQAFDKLDQAGPLLVELIQQIEAQRREIGPAVHELRQENQQALQKIDQTSPALEDLTRQIEAQRGEIDGFTHRWSKSPIVQEQFRLIAQLLDESRATFLKLDQANPLVQELVRQVEAQRDEINPVLREQLQQIEQLREESRHALDKLNGEITGITASWFKSPIVQEQFRLVAQLLEESQATLAKLDQTGPAIEEITRQLQAQRNEIGPAVQEQLQQTARLREESREILLALDRTGPLMTDLIRQVEAQRDEIGGVTARWIRSPIVQEQLRLTARLSEESRATVLKLDQAGLLVEQLNGRLETQQGAIGSIAHEQLQQITQLREDSHAALAKLEQTTPLMQTLSRQVEEQSGAIGSIAEQQQQQIAQLREESQTAFARLAETDPKLAVLIGQIEAQRHEIGAITSRWIRSPVVQEQLRQIGQLREENQTALGKLDQAGVLISELSRQIQGQRGEIAAITARWAESHAAYDHSVAAIQAQLELRREETLALAVQNEGLRREAEWQMARFRDIEARLDQVATALDGEKAARAHLASELDARGRELASSQELVGQLYEQLAAVDSDRNELHLQLNVLTASSAAIAQELAARESTIADMLASNSWRLTAPLRGTRRLFMRTPPSQRTSDISWMGRTSRAAYRALPISWSMRLRLKSMLFRALKPFVKNTNAYRRMLAAQQEALVAQERAQAREEDRWYFGPLAESGAPPPAESPAVVEQPAPVAPVPENAPVVAQAPSVAMADGDVYVPMIPEPVALAELRAKVIAFYLPQFHPIPENDEWWGRGFTEWTNVTKALPQFSGHDQPHLPGELGFYDLRVPEVMQRQIELAKHYGVHGFCFHYYWFDGRRILEKPLNQFLGDSAAFDFPFCVCWANENWTRRWDGADHDVLLGQNHTPDSDIRFIRDVEPMLRDPRYIRVDGRPLLIVYRPSLLPDCQATVARWREYCHNTGLGDLFLVMVQFDAEDPRPLGFDAAVEFPPHKLARDLPHINATLPGINPDFEGYIVDYQAVVQRAKHWPVADFNLIRGVFPGWDNEARKPNRGYLFAHHSPDRYRDWLEFAIEYSRQHPIHGEPLVFVNAWNEWAEGAYLEPDRQYGYAYLQATRDALTAGSAPEAQPQSAETSPPAIASDETAPVLARPRIVVVSHDAHPHGAQNLALHMVRELDKSFGFDVDLVLLGEGRLTGEFARHSTVHEAAASAGDLDAMQALAASLYAGGARAAIANTTVSGLFVGVLKRAGFRVISLVHELPVLIADNGLGNHARSIAVHADHVVFAAPQVRDGFAQITQIPDDKVVLRSQGLFTRSRYLGRDDLSVPRAALRAKLGIPADARVVLAVGYGDHRKGLDIFGDMAVELATRHPDLHFVWVGHYDEALMNSVRIQLYGCDAYDRLHSVGLDFDTDDYYAGADVYALTSREDPFPSVVLEALAVGLPVVAFAGTGGAEQILSRGCGVLVPQVKAHAFAVAVDALLHDPDTLAAYGREGRRIIEQEFSFRRYVFDLLDLAGIAPPKVSVVVPNYNYAHLMRDRLASINEQTLPVYEVIVLDDASTDNSLEVLSELRGSLGMDFTVVAAQSNSGSVFRQWHKGVEMAGGDYVWIAEADDLSTPEFLATALAPMAADPAVAMSYCQSRQIDENGVLLANDYRYYTDDISRERWSETYVCDGRDEIRYGLSVKNTIPNVSAVVFKREPLQKVLNEHLSEITRLRVAGDWMTYVGVLENWRVAFSPLSMNTHRRHSKSVTSATDQLPHLLEVVTIQKHVREHYQPAPELQAQANRYAQTLYEQFQLATEAAPHVEQNSAIAPLLARGV